MISREVTALLALVLMVGCKTMTKDTENIDPLEFYTAIADHQPEAIEAINHLSVRELNQYLYPEVTAIYAAAAYRNETAARLLIKKGVDVNRGGADGIPPLHTATYNNNEQMVRILLEAGANP